MSEAKDRIKVENINVPGRSTMVSRAMYEAMKGAMWKVLPTGSPGLTQSEIREAVVPHLPDSMFPGGAKAGWWAKTVQLDLEAKGEMVREATKPLRWYRAASQLVGALSASLPAATYGIFDSSRPLRVADH